MKTWPSSKFRILSLPIFKLFPMIVFHTFSMPYSVLLRAEENTGEFLAN